MGQITHEERAYRNNILETYDHKWCSGCKAFKLSDQFSLNQLRCRDCNVLSYLSWISKPGMRARVQACARGKYVPHARPPKMSQEEKNARLVSWKAKNLASGFCPKHPKFRINIDVKKCVLCCLIKRIDKIKKNEGRAPLHPDIAHLKATSLAWIIINELPAPGSDLTGFAAWEEAQNSGLLSTFQLSREYHAPNKAIFVDHYDLERTGDHLIPYDFRNLTRTVWMRTGLEQRLMEKRHGILPEDQNREETIAMGWEPNRDHGT